MFLIKTSDDFRGAAQRVGIRVEHLSPAPNTKSVWLQEIKANEEAVELVKSYNKSQFHSIQARVPEQRLSIEGGRIVWNCGRVSPLEGRIGVAIALPPPLIPDEDKYPSGGANVPSFHDVRQAIKQQPGVRLKIEGPKSHTIVIRVGDIIQFDAGESIAPETGGVAMILMHYRSCTPAPVEDE